MKEGLIWAALIAFVVIPFAATYEDAAREDAVAGCVYEAAKAGKADADADGFVQMCMSAQGYELRLDADSACATLARPYESYPCYVVRSRSREYVYAMWGAGKGYALAAWRFVRPERPDRRRQWIERALRGWDERAAERRSRS